jgi:hypothetical protein
VLNACFNAARFAYWLDTFCLEVSTIMTVWAKCRLKVTPTFHFAAMAGGHLYFNYMYNHIGHFLKLRRPAALGGVTKRFDIDSASSKAV